MLVNASGREWRGQLSYLRGAGFLKVESDMGRRPGETRAIPVESRVNWNESYCSLLLAVKAATCTEMHRSSLLRDP
jgi:hypothetical protein